MSRRRRFRPHARSSRSTESTPRRKEALAVPPPAADSASTTTASASDSQPLVQETAPSGSAKVTNDFIGMLASVASASSSDRTAIADTEQPQEFMCIPRPPQRITPFTQTTTTTEQPKPKPRRRKRHVSVFKADRCAYDGARLGDFAQIKEKRTVPFRKRMRRIAAESNPDAIITSPVIDEEPEQALTIVDDGRIVFTQREITVGVADQQITADVLQSARLAERERVTSLSYKKREKADRWSVEETKKFYNALRQLGTDFTMIGMLFPGRSRKQIKHKFKREEKQNASLIESALRNGMDIESDTLTSSIEQHLASIKDKDKKSNPDDTAAPTMTATTDAAREVVNLDSVSLGGDVGGGNGVPQFQTDANTFTADV